MKGDIHFKCRCWAAPRSERRGWHCGPCATHSYLLPKPAPTCGGEALAVQRRVPHHPAVGVGGWGGWSEQQCVAPVGTAPAESALVSPHPPPPTHLLNMRPSRPATGPPPAQKEQKASNTSFRVLPCGSCCGGGSAAERGGPWRRQRPVACPSHTSNQRGPAQGAQRQSRSSGRREGSAHRHA